MADFTRTVHSKSTLQVLETWKDMGDGTYARVLSADLAVGGVPLQLDDTDKLAVSLYGHGASAGSTPVEVNTSTGATLAEIGGRSAGSDARTNAGAGGIRTSSSANDSLIVFPSFYNGGTWDRQRNNQELTVLASAARTAATDSADQVNYNGRALIIIVSVTVDDASADLTPSLQIKDSISSAYYTVWTAAAAISAVGTFAYLFDSSALGDAAELYTEGVNLRIARTWRLHIAVADADSCTYSVSAVILV